MLSSRQRSETRLERGRTLAGTGLLAPAYGLILALVLLPLASLILYSLEGGAGEPLRHYRDFFITPAFVYVLRESLVIATWATLLTILIGWPLAYAIAKIYRRNKSSLIAILMTPFFVSYLLLIYAMMGLLQVGGPVQVLMAFLHLLAPHGTVVYSQAAVILMLVYEYLPFMTLAIYSSLEHLDDAVIEAARGLGAGPVRIFRHLLWPASLPGVAVGTVLVFIPAAGSFVEPQLLGGTRVSMLGNVIDTQINQSFNLPEAATLSLILMVFSLLGLGLVGLTLRASAWLLRRW